MTRITQIGLPMLVLSIGAAALPSAAAQNTPAPAPYVATAQDPPGPVPDAISIPLAQLKDLKWTGMEGRQQTAILWGDPSKPGPYGIMIKWYPGNFSRPHIHNTDRWAYVVSGTWWVSSSTIYDTKNTYPVHAGTYVVNTANTVHYDGNRAGEKEPALILLAGVGPVTTTMVDEQGQPVQNAGGQRSR
jgi:quercetin dioxygenase-like cupin family protein